MPSAHSHTLTADSPSLSVKFPGAWKAGHHHNDTAELEPFGHCPLFLMARVAFVTSWFYCCLPCSQRFCRQHSGGTQRFPPTEVGRLSSKVWASILGKLPQWLICSLDLWIIITRTKAQRPARLWGPCQKEPSISSNQQLLGPLQSCHHFPFDRSPEPRVALPCSLGGTHHPTQQGWHCGPLNKAAGNSLSITDPSWQMVGMLKSRGRRKLVYATSTTRDPRECSQSEPTVTLE